MRNLALACAVALALGCDPRPLDAAAGDAAPPSDAAHSGRVPRRHRAAGAACPAARGPGGRADECASNGASTDPSLVQCQHDSDCTAGPNGRCVPLAPPISHCYTRCSYDDCSGDADCPGGAPCECRASGSDVASNTCERASNCRVDADCGLGGYCSPSQVENLCFCPSTALCDDQGACYAGSTQVPCACGDSCGHGYYCHAKADTCVDDEDCAAGETCNFDRLAGHWQCAVCWGVP